MANTNVDQEATRASLKLSDTEKQELFTKAKDLVKLVDDTYYEMGGILYQINASQAYKTFGYETLAEFALEEFGYKQRKVQYLMQLHYDINNTFADYKEEMLALPWAKAKEIRRYANEENIAEIIEVAKNNSLRGFWDQMKDKQIPRTDPTSGEEYIPFNAKLAPEQKAVVDSAIKRAMKLGKTDKEGQALTLICTHYLGTHGAKSTLQESIGDITSAIKTATGVDLVPANEPDLLVMFLDELCSTDPAKVRESLGLTPSDGQLTAKEMLIYTKKNLLPSTPKVETADVGDQLTADDEFSQNEEAADAL